MNYPMSNPLIDPDAPPRFAGPDRLTMLRAIERRILWLSTWMIHHANHVRPNADGLKVGGHQASSASVATLMTALYMDVLLPADRVAVKPHASPVFHAIQYLLGRQTRDKLERFRAFGGAQSYPSRTKDTDDVDISTGSVGLGVAMTTFTALVQEYLDAHEWLAPAERRGRMVALVGDAELDEGNVYEALLEGWKHDVRDLWWVIDYNRQSLDAVISDRLFGRFNRLFASMGWDVVTIKYGKKLHEAFARPGGQALRQWIDACPNSLYSALVVKGGAAWREHVLADIGARRGRASSRSPSTTTTSSGTLMTNLGGHDMESVLEAFESVTSDQPTCFLAYTIKGYGLPFAGHKDNHSGLMSPDDVEAMRASHGVAPGEEWEPFSGLDVAEADMRRFPRRGSVQPAGVPAPERGGDSGAGDDRAAALRGHIDPGDVRPRARHDRAHRRTARGPHRDHLAGRDGLHEPRRLGESAAPLSPQAAGGHVLERAGRLVPALGGLAEGTAHRARNRGAQPVPDARRGRPVTFVVRRAPHPRSGPSTTRSSSAGSMRSPTRSIRMPASSSSRPRPGSPSRPRAARISRPPRRCSAWARTICHRSSPPSRTSCSNSILRWAFKYVQFHGGGEEGDDLLADGAGGSVYLRLSTRKIDQPARQIDSALERDILAGGYWMRRPAEGATLAIVYAGAVAPEASEAHAAITESNPGAGLLAATSPDRLYRGWSAAQRARRSGNVGVASHVEILLGSLAPDARIVTVIDGHPATLGWLGSVRGQRVEPLGVDRFGQSGSLPDLYREHGIGAEAILEACNSG